MRARLLAAAATVAVLPLVAACDSGDGAARSDLTRRQKDSLVAEMPIPGAGGVRRALDASDRATARARALDELAEPEEPAGGQPPAPR